MTPQEFKQIRIKMKLTQSEMAEWLHLSGDRIVRAWEAGEYKIPGSVQKCFELAGKLCLILFLTSCTNNLYEVNKRINGSINTPFRDMR